MIAVLWPPVVTAQPDPLLSFGEQDTKFYYAYFTLKMLDLNVCLLVLFQKRQTTFPSHCVG